jgi:hypothetical protein
VVHRRDPDPVRQRKGLFLAPESVVRQRQKRSAHIGDGGDHDASSHGRGIDEECFINEIFFYIAVNYLLEF